MPFGDLMLGLFQGGKVDRAATPPSSGGNSEFTKEQREDLRVLRAEIQDLQEILNDISKGESTLALCSEYIKKTKQDIGAIFKKISETSKDSSRREDLRRIMDVWEQMESNPIIKNPQDSFSAEDQLHHMNMLNKRIKKIK